MAKFKKAYEKSVKPMTDSKQWLQVNPRFKLWPPLLKRAPGQPRERRYKSVAKGDSGKRTTSSPVHGFRETGNQPAPNPAGPVIPVPSAGWTPTRVDPDEASGGQLVCGFNPSNPPRPASRGEKGVAAAKMPHDGVAQGLELEAALAAESTLRLREAVASMGGSLDMDVDSPPLLTVELVGDGSIPTPDPSRLNKDGEDRSLEIE
ncbi:hypothetical protein SEVIR_9G011150v4 [Setaria viridis]|uniref:Uncharacterized protein n=1 Tax=Setaria viridis TaxID=4556 RepID=A0A4U6SQX8_SETVI|nr:uncharacterized protein LOC117837680 [Setaria viridis]TKV90173.1 hypothetical protein SEVIR_9G011150v2 [Setaria viridis]TKV90174.1 hypothetical protein SEVIR_9G011150v2 [Setaria viridis]TKV90175.1 hypothetical protein SEVIR_9G011150v2 [Setaria viridis]TKV90176.1 hypothetical protein SEVIR_9G011150v2 [Setaria viridis]